MLSSLRQRCQKKNFTLTLLPASPKPMFRILCLYGVFALHGTSGQSVTGPTALRDFQTTSRANFYHQKDTSLTPQWNDHRILCDQMMSQTSGGAICLRERVTLLKSLWRWKKKKKKKKLNNVHPD